MAAAKGMGLPQEPVARADIRALTAYNLADVDRAFGVEQRAFWRAVVRLFAWLPARRVAQVLAKADALADRQGMPVAGALLVERFAGQIAARGAEIPSAGPVICVANHPGLVDAPALAAVIGRRDLRIIAAERPLLRALPGISRLLIEVPADAGGRGQALRRAARHVQAGGALLTFPAGRIEPDPAVMDDAADSLQNWSDMPVLLRRLVPDAALYALCVSGVCSPRALAHPWVQRRGARADREWLAATLQLMDARFRAPVVTVQAAPVEATQSVGAVMAQLIATAPRSDR
ncbi:MAG: hypothetical protein RLZZ297_1371 [Chloroflexota bacterium]|jgi:hypothetical protein